MWNKRGIGEVVNCTSRQAFSPGALQLPFVRSAGRGDGAGVGAAAAGERPAAGAGGGRGTMTWMAQNIASGVKHGWTIPELNGGFMNGKSIPDIYIYRSHGLGLVSHLSINMVYYMRR